MQQPTEIEKLIGELEIAVDRVRSLYDQYFMGIERLEPTVPRKDIDRRVQMLHKEQIRNTALRFRFHMILQRYNTFQSHWQRICREIENGTYKRHVLRADRRFGVNSSAPGPEASPAGQKPGRDIEKELAELDLEFAPSQTQTVPPKDLETFEPPTLARPPARAESPLAAVLPAALPKVTAPAKHAPVAPKVAGPGSGDAVSPAPGTSPGLGPGSARTLPARPEPRRPPGPAAAAPPKADPVAGPTSSPTAGARPLGARPPAGPSPPPARVPPRTEDSLPEYRVRQLYVEYVETKRRQNESTVALTYDALAQSLRESSSKLRQKHGKQIDFVVAVRDGKAILKPVLK